MNFFRHILSLAIVALAFSSTIHAECNDSTGRKQTINRDFKAVQEYVNSKRTIPIEEKACNLSIAGDVRFDWASIMERFNGQRTRGKYGTTNAWQVSNYQVNEVPPGIPFSPNEFDVQFNLYVDYKCDRAWGVVWVQFDNAAGINPTRSCLVDPEGLKGSGCCDGLCLKKAYIGYNLFADGCQRFDIEVGRRPLYTLFDSRIQFQSRFDGIVLKYNRSLNCWGDFYLYVGGFVIDERVNHYGVVSETGILNLYDIGLDFRYSYIDWKSLLAHNTNRCGTHKPLGDQFRVNQFLLAYNFNPDYLCVPAQIYGAFLWNAAASPLQSISVPTAKASKANVGWYAGFIVGEVCGEGDWSLDINYQYVEAQAIPGRDVSGIGRGGNNIFNYTLYGANGKQFDYTNYKGWRFEGLYALTDNLSLDTSFEYSHQIAKKYGGTNSYSKFEIEAIYAF